MDQFWFFFLIGVLFSDFWPLILASRGIKLTVACVIITHLHIEHVLNFSSRNIDCEFDPDLCLQTFCDSEGNRQETDKGINTFCVSGWRSSSRSLPPADGGGKVSAVGKNSGNSPTCYASNMF